MYTTTAKKRTPRRNLSFSFLSGHQLMWMMVLFDLPVIEKQERKEAAKFRKFLLEEGFSMSQFSVYIKLLSGKEAVEQYTSKINNALPNQGKVDIICITDKQYENIISYSGRTKSKQKQVNKQYLLF